MASNRKGGSRKIKAHDLVRFGPVVNDGVDLERAVNSLGTSKSQVQGAIRQARADRRNVMFKAISGRTGANLTDSASVKESLQAAYGRGPRGGAVDARAAAKDLGVSVSTVRRWAAGTQNPSAEHRKAVRGRARKAAGTKAGRRAAAQSFRQSDRGKAALRGGSHLTVGGYQAPVGYSYERNRSVSLPISGDEIEAMLNAYEDGGDQGLFDWMTERFDEDYVEAWEFSTIEEFRIGEE